MRFSDCCITNSLLPETGWSYSNTKISNFGVAISTPLHQGLVLKFSREDQTFKVKFFIKWLFALFWPARRHNGTIMLKITQSE